jgi:hypothetical protein
VASSAGFNTGALELKGREWMTTAVRADCDTLELGLELEEMQKELRHAQNVLGMHKSLLREVAAFVAMQPDKEFLASFFTQLAMLDAMEDSDASFN